MYKIIDALSAIVLQKVFISCFNPSVECAYSDNIISLIPMPAPDVADIYTFAFKITTLNL